MASASRVEKSGEAWGLRYSVLAMDMGHRCGYVRVPEGHPWFGLKHWDATDGRKRNVTERGLPDWDADDDIEYEDRIETMLRVHGGITYSGDEPNEECQRGWWFGFDCAHLGDSPDPELMSDVHKEIIGSSYGMNFGVVRSLEYVEYECVQLASQLQAARSLLLERADPGTADEGSHQ